MVTEYVDCSELKRLIEDKKLKASSMRFYLRKKGIIITATNPKDFAEQFYTIFLGASEIEEIRDLINSDGNYEKSIMMKIEMKNKSEEDILDIFADEINRIRTKRMEDYFIETPFITENELQVKFSYVRKLPGRNKLLQDEKRYLQMNIRKKKSTEVIIDIRQQSSIDTSSAVEFLENLTKSEENLKIRHINLDNLTDKNKIDFFDRVAAYKFKLWSLETITGITVKRGDLDDSEDIEDIEELSDGDGEKDADLTGISQAVLNGSGLRANEFVQNSLKRGYYISAMKYRYQHKMDVTAFTISLGFKGENVRIEIEKTYYEEDDKFYIQPMIRTEQNEIIMEFQDAVGEVYDALLEEQKK